MDYSPFFVSFAAAHVFVYSPSRIGVSAVGGGAVMVCLTGCDTFASGLVWA